MKGFKALYITISNVLTIRFKKYFNSEKLSVIFARTGTFLGTGSRVNPRLHGALFEIPPQIVADKYKFKWSLSDVELKAHYESSNGVSSALSFIGLDMRTFVGSAPIIGGILLEISKSGMKAGESSIQFNFKQ